MYLGVDVGSISINAALMAKNGRLIAWEILRSGCDHRESVRRVVEAVCDKAEIRPEQIRRVVSTGYGRRNVEQAHETYTEITCHAVGVRSLFEDAGTIIDIGGQDSKVIRLSPDGRVEHFVMNDKCAAGTGRFFEVMAGAMEMDLAAFSRCGLNSRHPYRISSTCTVFAESEVISGIAKGVAKEELVAGLQEAVVSRIVSMAASAGVARRVVLTGGVAKNEGIALRLRRRFPDLRIPSEPQLTGALGAALLGWQHG